mmetsp:Transcript_10902/g.40018  ORF Transcript_10902/g.40018 Transcript_10902/m.40018 type:complete len:179 (-) Transcript_10902:168-704(-)
MGADFRLPEFYNYPPYFTLQPNEETQQRQLELWRELILRYCQSNRIFAIDIQGDSFPLFSNESIQRTLNLNFKTTLFERMTSQGYAVWVDDTKRTALILWKSLDDWADAIHNWARQSAMDDAVLTLEELSSGVETRGQVFHELDNHMLERALRVLEQRGKARLFGGDDGTDRGVKFFP